MQKTYFYEGRVKSLDNTCAALSTTKYHDTKCYDSDGFSFALISEIKAKKYWKIFDFEKEVGKALTEEEAVEIGDFLC